MRKWSSDPYIYGLYSEFEDEIDSLNVSILNSAICNNKTVDIKWDGENNDFPVLTRVFSSGINSLRIKQLYESRRNYKNLSQIFASDDVNHKIKLTLVHKQLQSEPCLLNVSQKFCFLLF